MHSINIYSLVKVNEATRPEFHYSPPSSHASTVTVILNREMGSKTTAGADFQVFLSFRGPDTRLGFTDCLYHFLTDAGVRVFRDNEEIRPGERIHVILRAIANSTVCIPIFSKNFASSKWCLREVAEMVKLEKTIMPVFYDVRADDVKLKTDLYRKAMNDHKEDPDFQEWREALGDVVEKSGWPSDDAQGEPDLEVVGQLEVKKSNELQDKGENALTELSRSELQDKGEKALKDVGNIKGWNLTKNTGYGELCKTIVKEVLDNLRVKRKILTSRLVGMDDQVEKAMKCLDLTSQGVRFFGIYGIGGTGKTTLAKIIFNQICSSFDVCSFLSDVRESVKLHGLEYLLKKSMDKYISENEDGIKRVREIHRNKKVLIVLDDVDQKEQMENLADLEWFGSGSRIIITTRDMRILGIEHDKHDGVLKKSDNVWALELSGMEHGQALQLFCNHAFRDGLPPADYFDLSNKVVSVVGRLPLALEIVGSGLRGQSVEEWEDKIKILAKIPHGNIQKKLMVSYEALDYRTKQMFLDIACFPVSMKKTHAMYMWRSCGFHPDIGIEDLVSMSLIKVDEDGALWMHDHLRDVGREIVCMENFMDFAERSRLWMREEVLDVLIRKEGTRKIQMLHLSDDGSLRDTTLLHEAFNNLQNLRMLGLYGLQLSGNFENQLPKLRWLSWNSCPTDFKAVDLKLGKLVILDLSRSNITESWAGWSNIMVGDSLEVLDLSNCNKLGRTPDLSKCRNLKRLILEGCRKLRIIDRSIGKLKSLQHLNMKRCDSLQGLPEEMGGLVSLEEIFIKPSQADRLFRRSKSFLLPKLLSNLKLLKILDITGAWITELPYSIGELKKLEELKARSSHLEGEIPIEIGGLPCLRILDLSYTKICLLPLTIILLSRLDTLALAHCNFLQELPKLPSGLATLEFSSSRMKRIPDLSELNNLIILKLGDEDSISEANKLESQEIGWMTSSTRLQELVLLLRDVTNLHVEFDAFPQLSSLLLGCQELQYVSRLPSSLLRLEIRSISSVKILPCLSNLKSLSTLSFSHIPRGQDEIDSFEKLSLGELGQLKELSLTMISNELYGLCLPRSLTELRINSCPDVEKLPDLSHLEDLRMVSIKNCHKLVEVPGLVKVARSLKELCISTCKSLEKLDRSSFAKIKNLILDVGKDEDLCMWTSSKH